MNILTWLVPFLIAVSLAILSVRERRQRCRERERRCREQTRRRLVRRLARSRVFTRRALWRPSPTPPFQQMEHLAGDAPDEIADEHYIP